MQSALASSVEPALWKAPAALSIIAAELQELFNPKGLNKWLGHFRWLCGTPIHCNCLNRFSVFLALRSFVFCQNLFSGVWLWHCSKAFNKHLNSFPCDKNHGHSSSCLVAVWHFPKRLWDSLLAFLF